MKKFRPSDLVERIDRSTGAIDKIKPLTAVAALVKCGWSRFAATDSLLEGMALSSTGFTYQLLRPGAVREGGMNDGYSRS